MLVHIGGTLARIVKTGKCQICKTEKRVEDLFPGAMVRPSVFIEIQKEYPHFDPNEYICREDLNKFRFEQLRRLLEQEKGELTQLDHEVIQAIKHHEMLEAIEDDAGEVVSLGDRMADKIASFGGSWKFIILFLVILVGWMALNVFMLRDRAFDPFPFILLNLVLSCIAALQAPVIMMSQNRLAVKDRQREEHDYKTNLKAELEIRILHEKLDKLMTSQWQRLLEIQQIQMDFMEQISHKSK